jgi:4'-phosphopantetheinyl transferase EntD
MDTQHTPDASWFEPLFDANCAIEAAVPALVDDQLFPEERAFIQKAVPKRRAEFGTARLCARRALAQLGIAPSALVPEQDRAPRWPTGISGSISHTQGCCAVVVARSAHYRSLGLDVEQDKTLAPELREMICTAHERRVLGSRVAQDAMLYFAAKEAFYKCQYPLTQLFLDFLDVELEVDLVRGTFQARVLKAIDGKPAWIDRLPGRFIRRNGLWLCGVTLSAE